MGMSVSMAMAMGVDATRSTAIISAFKCWDEVVTHAETGKL